MPRKQTPSAILKSERTPEEKEAAKARSRHLADRRYRRKLKYNDPDKAKERMKKKRSERTEEEKAEDQERRKAYNATYYLKKREDIVDKQMKERARVYIEKHGEQSFWNEYPHRHVKFRKGLNPEAAEAKT
ncbi:hypothetical protein F5890DRAFT_1557578 [Lentinula detonsa]|uniref:Uncharacterized protein n=1 Tax=Lentinula detonsa TaxID=2804962 RepID=A0AA38UNG7_9AGAR|nr:hypothetical protein F5890DRAFT_1557578 [Lentinula detonsa]